MSRPSGPKSITAEQMVSGGELLQWSDTAVSKPAHAASTFSFLQQGFQVADFQVEGFQVADFTGHTSPP